MHSISILIFLLKLFVFIAIGLFPDVGSSAWLPHLTPGVGEYIGLTGVRLGPGDLLHTGIATQYITSNKIPQLEQLIETELTTTNADEARKVLQQILKHLHEAPPVTPEEIQKLGAVAKNHTNVIRDNADIIT